MVTIFPYFVKDMNTNGLGALLPSSCIIKEELNGMFELELEHPYDEYGKYERIKEDRVIKAMTPRGYQLFRVYKIIRELKQMKVYAKHITYDLEESILEPPFERTGRLDRWLQRLRPTIFYDDYNYKEFIISTNIKDDKSFKITKGTDFLKFILADDEENDSILKVYGGEIERNNYSIGFRKSIGQDRGFTIRYGKNLVGLTIDEDYSNTFNRLWAFGPNGLKLPENPIGYQYGLGALQRTKEKVIQLNVTTEEELRHQAYKILEASLYPTVNIKVNFQLLSKTEEYKDYAILENVGLGDIVTVENTRMKFSKKATVISYVYNSLLEKYESIELGDFMQDITKNFSNLDRAIQSSTTASKQLMNMFSGNVTLRDNNLYILVDNSDIDKATKLFRFGANGLQYSQNGVNGTYRNIIDSNGNVT